MPNVVSVEIMPDINKCRSRSPGSGHCSNACGRRCDRGTDEGRAHGIWSRDAATGSLTMEEETRMLWPSKVLCVKSFVVKQEALTARGSMRDHMRPSLESGLKRGANGKTASSAWCLSYDTIPVAAGMRWPLLKKCGSISAI